MPLARFQLQCRPQHGDEPQRGGVDQTHAENHQPFARFAVEPVDLIEDEVTRRERHEGEPATPADANGAIPEAARQDVLGDRLHERGQQHRQRRAERGETIVAERAGGCMNSKPLARAIASALAANATTRPTPSHAN
jgi:hypothetical protein